MSQKSYIRVKNIPASATFFDIITLLTNNEIEPDDISIYSRNEYNTVIELSSSELAKKVILNANNKSLCGRNVSITPSSMDEIKNILKFEPKATDTLNNLIAYLTGPRKEGQRYSAAAFNKSRVSGNKSAYLKNKSRYQPGYSPAFSGASSSVNPNYNRNKKKRSYLDDDNNDEYNDARKRFRRELPPDKPLEFELKEQSAQLAKVVWNAPREYRKYHQVKFNVSLYTKDRWRQEFPRMRQEVRTLDFKSNRAEYSYTTDLVAGNLYDIELSVSVMERSATPAKVILNKSVSFRASFNRAEVKASYDKACQFLGPLMHMFEVLYRCKPKEYYDGIYGDGRGDRLMIPYKKDENGQAANPINGAIDGLFFSAHLVGEHLPDFSHFGEVRMIVSADKLLQNGLVNLYFCDFYCNSIVAVTRDQEKRGNHYITVVACKSGSDTDDFCKKNLIPLPIFDNPFLKMVRVPDGSGRQYLVAHKHQTLVEVFYTEPISLKEAERFEKIKSTGSSRAKGIPHYKECKHCNLYPVNITEALSAGR